MSSTSLHTPPAVCATPRTADRAPRWVDPALRTAAWVGLALLLTAGRPWLLLVAWLRGAGDSAVDWLCSPAALAVVALPIACWLGRRSRRAPAPTPAAGRGVPTRAGRLVGLLVVGGGALAAVLFALAAQSLVFGRIPHVQDEIDYLWQARLFAGGQLAAPSHPLAEFFGFRFMVNDGHWYTLFQPGWPALLALGELLGAPWAVAPLLGGLLVLATWGVARETLPGRAALLPPLLLVASPWFLFMQSSTMAHGASALFGTAALAAWLVGWRRGGLAWLALAGLLLGGQFLVRALDAAVLGVPLVCWALVRGLRPAHPAAGEAPAADPDGETAAPPGQHGPWPWPDRRRALAGLAACCLAGLAVAALQFGYNRALTGDARVWPQDRYFALTESRADCHRLGFGPGVGCPREHGPDLAPGGFGFRRALQVSTIRLRSLAGDLWGPGPGLLLVALGAVVRWPGGRRRRWPLLVAAAGPFVGYFFYYYHGNCFGARYYYTALPAMTVLVAGALLALAGGAAPGGRGRAAWAPRLRRAAVVALVIGLVVHALAREVPRLWQTYSGGYWGVHDGLARLIADRRLTNAVVLIPPSSRGPEYDDRDFRIGFAHARPEIAGSPVVIARDLGPSNPQLAAWFPGRRFFRYHPWDAPRGLGSLSPLRLDGGEATERLVAEGEARFPPPARFGGTARVRPWPVELGAPASGGHLLAFVADRPGDGFELRQQVFAAGEYRLGAELARGPGQGLVRVTLDGHPLAPDFDGFASRRLVTSWQAEQTVRLEPGRHTLRWFVVGRSPAATGLELGLDRFELVRER